MENARRFPHFNRLDYDYCKFRIPFLGATSFDNAEIFFKNEELSLVSRQIIW